MNRDQLVPLKNEDYKKKQAQKSRRKICNVRTLSIKISLADQSRSDDTAKTIVARIGFLHDLVAVQVWLDNQLEPEQWGWKHANNALEPTTRFFHLHQKTSLILFFATAKKGQSCSIVESPTEEGFYINDETSDVSLLIQLTSTQKDEEEEENRERGQCPYEGSPLGPLIRCTIVGEGGVKNGPFRLELRRYEHRSQNGRGSVRHRGHPRSAAGYVSLAPSLRELFKMATRASRVGEVVGVA
ncbi:hypothetical protein J6590_065551 [Homalodisca vitripennis]|nr:hypothetical protein J6590_065551 [Homalodisca vitripennis]